jgi:hypothetical protein
VLTDRFARLDEARPVGLAVFLDPFLGCPAFFQVIDLRKKRCQEPFS